MSSRRSLLVALLLAASLRSADGAPAAAKWGDYRLLATSKTSTMQKEMQQAAGNGYTLCGLTVGETLFGGKELVVITKRPRSGR